MGGGGEEESGSGREQNVMFHFRKNKINQKLEVHTQVCGFLLPQKGQQVSAGLQLLSHASRGAGEGGGPPHCSRWTMTALRRLACCSVWLSSSSSLLGKVVMRTNSLAAMLGRAVTTNCRRSDTLWVLLNF